MSREQSLIIVGYGYADCLLGGAIVALKEKEEGRGTELRFSSMNGLAGVLAGVLLQEKRPGVIYLVGIGLGRNSRLLAEKIESLGRSGVRVVWLSNQEMGEQEKACLSGLLEERIGDCDLYFTEMVYRLCAPWGKQGELAKYLAKVGRQEDPDYGRMLELAQTAGFVNRVMRSGDDHGRKVLALYLNDLLSRRTGGESAAMRRYMDLFRLYGHREIKGRSRAVQRLKEMIIKAAPVDDVRVMILGESGTGKESVAVHLHLNSPRWNQTFLSFNCASSNPGLLEATFLGYRKGAFTGASGDKKGVFELACSGTLFLDEIGDLPLESQGVLLRILEEKRLLPLGGTSEVEVNVRLITATNKNLWKMAKEGTFREDLLFRLQEFTVTTVPLREMMEDVAEIADALWRGRKGVPLPDGADEVLMTYSWPGNVRELSNFLKYADVMGHGNWRDVLSRYLENRGTEEKTGGEDIPGVMPVRLDEGAQQYRYCRPVLDNSMTLRIVNGRHPVIEQNVSGDVFVPNDAFLEPEENRLILLTGPNMAGKSTYIRQVALITLMAQIGAYVPAEAAHIGLVDRIFCRVGASDDLARGQSTFMVEMSETSLILNNATERSLIILDEIGRGTATFDGLSIAWAVAEYLHDELKSRTLFATHYHELTDLANSRQGVQNYNVAVREWKEEIVFLRKIVPGAADKSYGIQVARLAGMPAVIVDRAKAILSHLEMNSTRPRKKGRSRLAEPRAKNTDMDDDMPVGEYAQLELF